MAKNHEQRAQDGHNEFNRRAQQSHNDFQRAAQQSHSSFESGTKPTHLDSGQTQKVNPTDIAASGETSMVTFYTVATILGSVAAAAFLGRRGRGSN